MCRTCDITNKVAEVFKDEGLTSAAGDITGMDDIHEMMAVVVNLAASCIAAMPSREMRNRATACLKSAVEDQVKQRRSGQQVVH